MKTPNQFSAFSYGLVLLITLFILGRLGMLLFGYSHIAHPYFDEPVSGTLTNDLVNHRLRAPLFVYQYENRSGDVLIEALLMVPFYKLFGATMFSMKLFALTATVLSLAFWIIFLRKYCGPGVAFLFAALLAIPPPMMMRLNLVGTLSSHHMLNIFVPLQLIFIFNILDQSLSRKLRRNLIGFGLVAGLGAYTFYSYIIFNLFSLLFLFVFRRALFSRRNILLFFLGAAIGFSPWLYRTLYSSGGAVYLGDILKHVSISLWPLLQSFGFNIAHSFGYGYPGREIGVAGIGFTLLLLIFLVILTRYFCTVVKSVPGKMLSARYADLSASQFVGIFIGFFPVFFLLSLSFSPKQVDPVEYWPHFGLFATFAPSDMIRYRWLHILYPFYLGLAAMGTVHIMKSRRVHKFMKRICVFILAIFFLLNAWKIAEMYSSDDFGKLSYYKGYSYDLMATRFIFSDFSSLDLAECRKIARNYPLENRFIAYRHLGTRVFLKLIKQPAFERKLLTYFETIPRRYVPDSIYGIISTFHSLSNEDRRTVTRLLSENFSDIFYEIWASRFLAYKYYGYLLNQKVLLRNIPGPEQFFFKPFFADLKRRIEDTLLAECVPGAVVYDREVISDHFLAEINAVPKQYRPAVAKGIGRLIWAEMLFDPLSEPDYPLSSSFGERLDPGLRDAFNAGIGAGFAETLCRNWRRLIPPETVRYPEQYIKMLEVEWQRYERLFAKMPAAKKPAIFKGFKKELRERWVLPQIKNYLIQKLKI